MRVQFIGVGEAFDESHANNSQLLEWDDCRLLIDCGYAVPHSLWKLHPDPEYLDAIYISHRHADHYFGLPSYLIRLAEDGRKKTILILCPEDMKRIILEMIDYAYLGILSYLTFPLAFLEVTQGAPLDFRGVKMEFAQSRHPVKNFAIAVSVDGKKYAYSGDGNFNEHTKNLYVNSTLLVHEAYAYDEVLRGHARITDVLQMAKEQGVKKLALTHIQREIRKRRRADIQELIRNSGLDVIIPETGDVCEI